MKFTVNDVFKQQGLDKQGCNYVPLGLTIDEGMDNRWHTYDDTLNNSSGVAVTTSCKDPDAAFKFLNDLLDQEIHDLRFWGIEGVDYLVDENGLYYRTEEMRTKAADKSYQASHFCNYSYMPQYLGTSRDGINAMQPAEQTSEFSNAMTTGTPGGVAWTKMGEVKHEWLPRVVMASDFEKEWGDYMSAYSAVNPGAFLAEMQEELNRRAG